MAFPSLSLDQVNLIVDALSGYPDESFYIKLANPNLPDFTINQVIEIVTMYINYKQPNFREHLLAISQNMASTNAASVPNTKADTASVPNTKADTASVPNTKADTATVPDTKADTATVPSTKVFPRNMLCTHYNKGFCKLYKTGKCMFRHNICRELQEENSAEKKCFPANGCLPGSPAKGCLWGHPRELATAPATTAPATTAPATTAPVTTPSVRKNKKHIPCKFFSNGTCKYGDDCIYNHNL
jgi:hypothetical protein